ncbi:MAG: hypothetical protein JSW08_01615 [archaeon]|nr:MAG: hypothetical protein JSW08_01615 [archaeon]
MISEKQLEKIKEFLDNAANPVFFFDNDVDGLASFLLLRRYCGKGKGIAIKSYPELNEMYARKLHEFQPDVVFVLDKPLIAREFVEEAEKLNCPIIWIDHHPPEQVEGLEDKFDKSVFYFNPLYYGESNEPTVYICYKSIKNKQDEWIALLGCLADWYIPEFAKEFSAKNKEFFPYADGPARGLFNTPLGKIVKILSFALKDRTTNIVKMLRVLIDLKSYSEFSEENKRMRNIYRRFKQINKRYEKLIDRAKKVSKFGRLFFFTYGGPLSMSSEIANELFYMNQDKVVVAAYIKGIKANVSIRGIINVKELVQKALKGLDSTSGGHKNSCGATLNVTDLPKFKRRLLRLLK